MDTKTQEVVRPLCEIATPLSETDAATHLGVSVRTLQDWRARGTTGPAYIKLGKRVAYEPADLLAFKAASRVEPKAIAA